MNLKSLIITVLALILPLASAFSQSEIKAGGSIQITIQGVPTEEKAKIDGLYPVGVNGTINMPFLDGPIKAASLRPEQLAASIEEAYKRAQIYRNPTINVFAAGQERIEEQVVHVGGEVKIPGRTRFTDGLTLWQAIQAAGGATPFGSMKRVTLVRGGKQRQYDVTQAQFMNIPLKPDDTIMVPHKVPFRG
jgi:protein involved in polysaccharide export with SLBB domain